MENETGEFRFHGLIVLYSDLKRFAFWCPILIFKTTGVKVLRRKASKQKRPTQSIKSQKLVQIGWGRSTWYALRDSNPRPSGPQLIWGLAASAFCPIWCCSLRILAAFRAVYFVNSTEKFPVLGQVMGQRILSLRFYMAPYSAGISQPGNSSEKCGTRFPSASVL